MIKILLVVILLLCIIFLIKDLYIFRGKVEASKTLITKSQKFERKIPGAKQEILIFGDSTAFGTGASDKSKSIAGLLGSKLPEAEILNFGIVGAKVKDVLDVEIKEFEKNYENYEADIILIQVGANDITHFTNIKNMETDLRLIIEKSRKFLKDNGRIIILHSGNIGSSPIFPFYVSYLITERTRKVREMYIVVVNSENQNNTLSYVDLFQEKKDDIFLSDISKYFAADYFHPTDAGYQYWFDKIVEKLGY